MPEDGRCDSVQTSSKNQRYLKSYSDEDPEEYCSIRHLAEAHEIYIVMY